MAGDAQFSLRLMLGGLLLLAAASKTRSFSTFAEGLEAYQIVPRPLAKSSAAVVVASELAIAVLLISGSHVQVSAALAALLFTSFLVGVAINLLRSSSIDCQCFGILAAEPVSIGTGIRLVLLISASVALAAVAAASGELSVSAPVPAVLLALGTGLLLVEIGSLGRVISALRARPPSSIRDGQRISLRHAPLSA